MAGEGTSFGMIDRAQNTAQEESVVADETISIFLMILLL